jgi:hypothetical protein
MVFLKRHLAHQTDYCTFELDEYRTDEGHQMLLAHLRVQKWSPRTTAHQARLGGLPAVRASTTPRLPDGR